MFLQGRNVERRGALLGNSATEDGAPACFPVATNLDGDGRGRGRIARGRRVYELGVNGKLIMDGVEAPKARQGIVRRVSRQECEVSELAREEGVRWRRQEAAVF